MAIGIQDLIQGGRLCPVLNVSPNTASTQGVHLDQSPMANSTDIQRRADDMSRHVKSFPLLLIMKIAYNSLQTGTTPRMIRGSILTLERVEFTSTGESLKHNPL